MLQHYPIALVEVSFDNSILRSPFPIRALDFMIVLLRCGRAFCLLMIVLVFQDNYQKSKVEDCRVLQNMFGRHSMTGLQLIYQTAAQPPFPLQLHFPQYLVSYRPPSAIWITYIVSYKMCIFMFLFDTKPFGKITLDRWINSHVQ